jgi:MFS family permease
MLKREAAVLRRYLLTALLARLADEGMGIAMALLALDRSGSPAAGGLVMAAWMAPHLLAAPLTGVYAERARRPGLFYGAALAAFGAAIALLALLAGRVPLGVLLLVAAAGGSCGPVVSGGLSGLLATLVPEPERARAYGLDAAVFNIAWTAGPALVAVLAAAGSPALATAVLAASAVAAALLAAGLRAPPAARRAEVTGRRISGELASGLRALARVPELRAITAASCLAIFGTGGVTLTAVLLATGHGTPGGGGLLLTLLALGALGSSLLVARRPPRITARALAGRSLLMSGTALAAAAFAPSFALCAVCFALAGLAEGPLLSATLRIRAEHAPPEVRTQIFALGAGLKITAAAGGAALVALFAERLSPAVLLLAIAAVQFAAAGLLGAAAGNRRQNFPADV